MRISLKQFVVNAARRLNKKYRVVVLDNESLSQSRFWMVKPIGMVVLGFLAFILIGGIFVLLFIFTPLNSFLPGRANTQLETDYKELKKQTERLKAEVEQYGSMINSLQSVSGIQGPEGSNGADPGLNAGSLPSNGSVSVPESGTAGTGNTQAPPKTMPSYTAPLLGMLNFFPPVHGEVRRNFNDRDTTEGHFGIDIVAAEGTMIRSIADGVVIFSEYSNETGYVIGVMHPRYNLVSFYKHNSRLFLKPGSFVFAGESIAVIGNSGRNSTGTHLHFELWYNGEPVDPEKFIHF